MSEREDGGSVSPSFRERIQITRAGVGSESGDFMRERFFDPVDGMTLRDYFAAKAMQATVDAATSREGEIGRDDEFTAVVATLAYRVADAMLKERSK